MRWSTRSVLKEDERRFTPWTIYPFERRNSARYAPSCPVAPVMRATLRDDPAITAAHLTLVRIPPQHKRPEVLTKSAPAEKPAARGQKAIAHPTPHFDRQGEYAGFTRAQVIYHHQYPTSKGPHH